MDTLIGTTRPEITGEFGMVASTHWIASAVGMAMLERGGNAADAAVAAGFVLQVVEPHLNGPAGEVPILVAGPDGDPAVVCGQGVAPAAATPQAFAGLGLDAVPGTGLLAATVPGAFGAWTVLLERWGTLSLREVLEPAIRYARHGAPLLARTAATLAAVRELFVEEWTPSAQTYLDQGRAPGAGERLRLPGLAATYERVLAEADAAGGSRERRLQAARDAWYRGFVAEEIGRFCATTRWRDTSGERHAGLLTADDLAGWEPTVEPPVRGHYRDVEVLKAGPWSQGPVLLQQLALLERVLAADDPLRTGDVEWVHLLVECQKLAFADREAWYGDPAAADVPLGDLLSRSTPAPGPSSLTRARPGTQSVRAPPAAGHPGCRRRCPRPARRPERRPERRLQRARGWGSPRSGGTAPPRGTRATSTWSIARA